MTTRDSSSDRPYAAPRTSARSSIIPRSPARAMTLTELLVVMGIIIVVSGLVAVTAMNVWGGSQRKRTQTLIQQLATACEEYKSVYGAYPVDDGGPYYPTGSAYDNSLWTREHGIRNLYVALKMAGLADSIKGDTLSTVKPTDNASFEFAVECWDGEKHRWDRVLVDAWGHPLIYDSHNPKGKYYSTRAVHNVHSFDLISKGPDGHEGPDADGNNDDIANFKQNE